MTRYPKEYLQKKHAVESCATELAAKVLARDLFATEQEVNQALQWWKDEQRRKEMAT